jgi:hypothetical protein
MCKLAKTGISALCFNMARAHWHAINNRNPDSTYAYAGASMRIGSPWFIDPWAQLRCITRALYPMSCEPTAAAAAIVTIHPSPYIRLCMYSSNHTIHSLTSVDAHCNTSLRADETKVAVISFRGSFGEVTVNRMGVKGNTSSLGLPAERRARLEHFPRQVGRGLAL